MKKDFASYLLEKTRENYNLIAEDFSSTRQNIPSDFKPFLEPYFSFDSQIKILDWGCGNGRFYPLFKDCLYYGVDISEKLINLAKQKYPSAIFSLLHSPLSLPFDNNFFDEIICLAVFHHIPSQEFRQQFLQEAWRVLKPNGIMLLTVWDLRIGWLLRSGNWKRLFLRIKYFFLHLFGRTPLNGGDFYIPWAHHCNRYLHAFSFKELNKLFQTTGFQILQSGTRKDFIHSKERNIYFFVRKTKFPQ